MKLIKCKRIGYALLALLFALFVTAMPVSMAGGIVQVTKARLHRLLRIGYSARTSALFRAPSTWTTDALCCCFHRRSWQVSPCRMMRISARRSTIYSFSIIWPKPPGHTMYDTKRKTAPRPRMNPGIPGCARAAWPLSVLHMDSSPFSVRDHGTCPIPGKPRRGISFPGEARANSPLLA